jgi:hypothetical protein
MIVVLYKNERLFSAKDKEELIGLHFTKKQNMWWKIGGVSLSKYLLALANTIILDSEWRATHDHIFMSPWWLILN